MDAQIGPTAGERKYMAAFGCLPMADDRTLQKTILGLVLGLACIAGGGFLTYDALEATVSAEETTATVVDSQVGRVSGTEREYRVHVTYEYIYQGETYTSDNIYAGAGGSDRFSSRGTAESFVQQYPEGETVTAYVDPDDPSRAHLETGIRATSLLGYALLVLVGVVTFAAGLKQLRSVVGGDE